MNVERILEDAFLEEARRQNLTLIESELNNIRKKFNIDAVQRAVDEDIERIRRRYAGMPYKQQEEIEKRERYHRQNLRKLAQDYARLLAERRITYLTESAASETRIILKESAAKPCDIYPC